MEKRIPLIRMGGTIGTTINNGTMETNKHASLALLNLYNQRKDAYPVQWIQEQDFGVLSENNTVNTWNQLLESLREIVQRNQNYDGIIITHGTDTLAYTAALLSVVCKGMNLPIFLVSSHRPLLNKTGNPDPQANGVDNFAAAVSAIYQGITPGVYVPYRNPSNGVMHMHKGEQITQCPIYSDNFSSYPFARNTQAITAPALLTCPPLTDCVLQIQPYVGLNYNRLNLEGVKAVLHGVYHSGTACVDDGHSPASLVAFADQCQKQGIPVYLAPAKTSTQQTVYASVPALEQTAIRFCYGHTNEWLYTALLYAYSAEMTQEEVQALIQ